MIRTTENLTYELTRKRVKNINLRIGEDGSIRVSASKSVPVGELDRFVASRAAWIASARERVAARDRKAPPADIYSDSACLAVFVPVCQQIYPQFADILPEMPEIRVRWMKSRWGVCHISKRRIVLNKQLMGYPLAALEYVVLHEFVHFLQPNHQAGFHREMVQRMPDYLERRALLK